MPVVCSKIINKWFSCLDCCLVCLFLIFALSSVVSFDMFENVKTWAGVNWKDWVVCHIWKYHRFSLKVSDSDESQQLNASFSTYFVNANRVCSALHSLSGKPMILISSAVQYYYILQYSIFFTACYTYCYLWMYFQHINELSMKIDVEYILCKAEAISMQMMNCKVTVFWIYLWAFLDSETSSWL